MKLFFSDFGSIQPGDNALDCGLLSFLWLRSGGGGGGETDSLFLSLLGDGDRLQGGAGRAAALGADQRGAAG